MTSVVMRANTAARVAAVTADGVRAGTTAGLRSVIAVVVRAVIASGESGPVNAAGVRAVNAESALVGPGLIHFFCTSFLQYFLLPRAHIGLLFLFHICGGQ
jgi:hypothetical protein